MTKNKKMKTFDYTPEEKIIAEAIADARKVQEFIWQEDSVSLCPFDQDNWIRIFQKRIDKIRDLKLDNPNYVVELRKRLLQQAALSVLALRLVNGESKHSSLKSMRDEKEEKHGLSVVEINELQKIFDSYWEQMLKINPDLTDENKVVAHNEWIICQYNIKEHFNFQSSPQPQPGGGADMVNFILEIDYLTTSELCKKFNVPEPKFTGDIKRSSDQFLQIDAIKHRMFVEKAKEYRTQSEGKDMYPAEFIEWIGWNEMFFETRYPNDPDHNRWIHEMKKGKIKYRTTKELFDYWKSSHK